MAWPLDVTSAFMWGLMLYRCTCWPYEGRRKCSHKQRRRKGRARWWSRWSLGPARAKGGKDQLRAGDMDDDDEASEPPDLDAPMPPNCFMAHGFQIRTCQVANSHDPDDLEGIALEVQEECGKLAPMTPQQALRFTLGMNCIASGAVEAWSTVVAWREDNAMEAENVRLVAEQQVADGSGGAHLRAFPHYQEVNDKIVLVSPAAIVTSAGYPVLLISIGSPCEREFASVSVEDVKAFSRSIFEFISVWLSQESEHTGKLLGYYMVFDLSNAGWSHLMSSDFHEKAKALLSSAAHYPESCYHTYIMNAPSFFSMVWKIAKVFVSERAAAKISVDNGVCAALFETLRAEDREAFDAVLQAARQGSAPPVRRLPRHRAKPP